MEGLKRLQKRSWSGVRMKELVRGNAVAVRKDVKSYNICILKDMAEQVGMASSNNDIECAWLVRFLGYCIQDRGNIWISMAGGVVKMLNEIALFLTFRKVGGRCPFCGKRLMPGQNGFYCVCSKWNKIHKEAYRRRML